MNTLAPAEKEHHWQHVYSTRDTNRVSWFTPHLDCSLALIKQYAPHLSDGIIDVGGGASTLVDDLLAAGYQNLSVLDISESALQISRQRLGGAADKVCWLQGDITSIPLPQKKYTVWHDRAVFHFLVQEDEQQGYVKQLAHALQPGGHAVIATFGPDGPTACSDLPTARYDAALLSKTLGDAFLLQESKLEVHTTPFATTQQFLYACFKYTG